MTRVVGFERWNAGGAMDASGKKGDRVFIEVTVARCSWESLPHGKKALIAVDTIDSVMDIRVDKGLQPLRNHTLITLKHRMDGSVENDEGEEAVRSQVWYQVREPYEWDAGRIAVQAK